MDLTDDDDNVNNNTFWNRQEMYLDKITYYTHYFHDKYPDKI